MLRSIIYPMAILLLPGFFFAFIGSASEAGSLLVFSGASALFGSYCVVKYAQSRQLALAESFVWSTDSFRISYRGFIAVIAAPGAAVTYVLVQPEATVNASSYVPSVVLAVGLLGVVEEVLFRAILLSGFTLRGATPLLANATQALLFGVLHVGNGPLAVVAAFVSGLVYGAIALQRRTIFIPALLHVVWNVSWVSAATLLGEDFLADDKQPLTVGLFFMMICLDLAIALLLLSPTARTRQAAG